MRLFFVAIVCMFAFVNSAEARHRHHYYHHAARHHHTRIVVQPACIPTNDIMNPCAYNPNFLSGIRSITVKMHRESRAERRTMEMSAPIESVQAQYLPHPAGCPRIAFCGCGAAQEVGLSHDRSLWLAASWYKFPRSNPEPGAAMVRSHHVAILKQHIQGNVWLVADYNSGGHQSRLHARSIAGYTIVMPRA